MPDALTILHVDMDAFYASVEQRDHPEWRGRPVIVGGTRGRGVVCAASYEARPFGVHSAMPVARARRLCPHAIFAPPRMGHYAEISRQIRDIFFSFTPLVEPLSLDEAFLDVRGCEGLFGPAPEIARRLKQSIKAETALIASVGVAPNKFLAKLAGDLSKPDGLAVLPAEQVRSFLAPLPVSRLWGVGAKTAARFHALGLHTIGDVAELPEAVLRSHFGESGGHFWRLAHGEDGRTVVPDREAVSISTETTFAEDIGDRQVLRAWLLDLVDELGSRLRHAGLRARTVELKLRSAEFETRSASRTLEVATDATALLWQAARQLFEKPLTRELLPLRLLGVGATKLVREGAEQRQLFEDKTHERHRAVDRAVDAIREQFGDAAIGRGNVRKHDTGSP